ncbi:MAG TPA: helix-turn-helix domain-containing protein [Isosphaeraceae bacterium]|nr:helix-turn-helix domain-containing protein [Isosphaeraceae bacterium]
MARLKLAKGEGAPALAPADLDYLMRLREVSEAVQISTRTLYKMLAARTFPAADLRCGSRITRWRRSTVRAWMDANARSKAITSAA